LTKLTEKGIALRKKFRVIQYTSVGFFVLAAVCFVFIHSIPLLIFFAVVALLVEAKFYRCPHCHKTLDCSCHKTLDCRRRIPEDTVCHHCQKYIFRGLD